MILRCGASVAAFFALLCPLKAATSDPGLKGISEVGVRVSSLGVDEKRAGLTEAQLLEDVQAKLKQSGLRVVDMDKAAGIYLDLHPKCAHIGQSRSFVYSVLLFFRQPVLTAREPRTLLLDAITWSDGEGGISPEEKLTTHVREATAGLVDSFLRAYLAENPK